MSQEIKVVNELPHAPIEGATYSFAKITRDKVTYATHGLHKYPAKFIPQFPEWGLRYDPDTPKDVVLDPFCGSGTTLVEAGLAGSTAIGVDISPLAILISEAKCTIDAHLWDAGVPARISTVAEELWRDYERQLRNNRGNVCLGMHGTWSNWFNETNLSRLLALREAITRVGLLPSQEKFFLAVLSSIVKACSYLNEDQIKVRFDKEKSPADPFEAFDKALSDAIASQRELSARYEQLGSNFRLMNASAATLPIPPESVDRAITSPPYINAIDYTMAHKYNLFVLGLLDPLLFKDHCREYIGVTERAVRVADLESIPNPGNDLAAQFIDALIAQDTPTSRNRAYVVAQYFSGMLASFRSVYDCLRNGGLYVFVVGESNRICGLTVPTAEILCEQAQSVGFTTELRFFHHLANRSSMRLSRSETGGTIGREVLYVFRK